MYQPPTDEAGSDQPADGAKGTLAERIEALSAWITEIEARVHTTVDVPGDKKAAKDLRRAMEALAKRDPKFEERLTNKVDVVADRVTTLGKTLNTTAAALAAKDGEIATLRRELQEGNARIEAVVAELRRTLDAANPGELRRAIAALSDERTAPKGADRRLDGLTGKVDVLAQRLDTLAGTVAATAAGLAGREGEIATLRRRLEHDTARVEAAIGELRTLVDPRPVEELREAVKTVSDETSAVKRSSQRGLDTVTSRVDTLTGRLDSVATTAGITASGLAEREREIAALRASFDEENRRLDSLVVKLQHAHDALSSQVAMLESAADRDVAGPLEERIDGVSGSVGALETRVDALASALGTRVDGLASAVGTRVDDLASAVETRVDALASAVETAAKEHAGKDEEVAALARRFEQASARVDTLVGDLRTALETMPRLDPGLETRFEALADSVEALGGRLVQAETAASTWTDEREWVRERLEELGSQESTGPVLAELTARLDAIERDRESAPRSEAAAPREEAAPRVDEETERRLAELTGRLDGLEGEREAVASELVRVWQTRASDRLSLESRLDDVATKLAEAASSAESGTSDSAEREIWRLRDLVEGVRTRMASSEQQLASLAERDADARLDELAWRLDVLESTAGSATAPASAPQPGEGRFRLELRGLELRMEHAEAAARENREAVLMQLDRLASSIEWRLQRLEAPEVGTAYPPSGDFGRFGEVVPIRASDS